MGMGGGPVGRNMMPAEMERGMKMKGKKSTASGKKGGRKMGGKKAGQSKGY